MTTQPHDEKPSLTEVLGLSLPSIDAPGDPLPGHQARFAAAIVLFGSGLVVSVLVENFALSILAITAGFVGFMWRMNRDSRHRENRLLAELVARGIAAPWETEARPRIERLVHARPTFILLDYAYRHEPEGARRARRLRNLGALFYGGSGAAAVAAAYVPVFALDTFAVALLVVGTICLFASNAIDSRLVRAALGRTRASTEVPT